MSAPPAVLVKDYTPRTAREGDAASCKRLELSSFDALGPLRMTTLVGWSDLLALPTAPFEKNDANGSDEAFGDDDGPEDALGLHAHGDC
jgi:hypothetical protein